MMNDRGFPSILNLTKAPFDIHASVIINVEIVDSKESLIKFWPCCLNFQGSFNGRFCDENLKLHKL